MPEMDVSENLMISLDSPQQRDWLHTIIIRYQNMRSMFHFSLAINLILLCVLLGKFFASWR
jgi:hypothetical protein